MGYDILLQMFMVMVLGGFGGGDMADYMSTDGYWKAKNVTVTVDQLKEDAKGPAAVGDITELVKDLASTEFKVRDAARKKIEAMGPGVLPQLDEPAKSTDDEVAQIAKTLQKKLAGHSRERDLRRLMAIRTLGEKKEASAVAVLEEGAKSKEMFVAEYAARALALIQGKPVPVREPTKIDADVWLIPGETAVVGQFRAGTAASVTHVTLDTVMENAMGMMGGPGGDPAAVDAMKKERIASAYSGIVSMLEKVGNVRLEGVTVGVSKDIADRDDKGEKGWAVVILRGRYDRDAVIEAIKGIDSSIKVETEDGVPAVSLFGSVKALLPSNEMAVVMFGPREEAMPFKEIKAALKAGKGALADSTQAARIKTLQAVGGPAWALITPNESMKKTMDWLTPLDFVEVTTKIDEKERMVAFTLTGEGTDAEKVKAGADALEADIKKAGDQMRAMAAQVPYFKGIVAIFDSMKVEAKEKKATLTGKLPMDVIKLMGGVMME